jgi:hypothetical protein
MNLMLKNGAGAALMIACLLTCPIPTLAEEPAPAAAAQDSPPPAVPQDAPLAVSGVTVDKTDKNAVLARTAAIAEAKRGAFQKLAERRFGAEGAKSLKLPDDATLSSLVQDFEITSEQLSAKRYVATFTIRFTPQVEEYLKAPAPQAAEAPPVTVTGPAVADGRSILVLPYFETETARLLLWEDTNGWLKAWQDDAPAAPGWTIAVPLGDISDVAAGSSDGVWSNDFAALDKLLTHYGATEAVLAVASRSNDALALDLYDYKTGRLDHLGAPPPVPQGKDDAATYKAAEAAVIQALQKPMPVPQIEAGAPAYTAPPVKAEGAAAAPDAAPPATAETAPAPLTGVPVAIDGEMNFDSAARWLEMQKRLAALNPPAAVEIRSLSSASAAFTLKFNGSLETLKVALAAHGVALSSPVVEIDQSVPGGTQTTENPVYELKLVN